MTRTTEEESISGEPTADLIEEELAGEHEWRRSLDQRALSLFASAGVIASLAGIAVRGQALPTPARILLALGVAAFALGAILGLVVAFPRPFPSVIELAALREALSDEQWESPAAEHLRRASRARLDIIEGSRGVNHKKAVRLRGAIWCAGCGIPLLLAAIVVALFP